MKLEDKVWQCGVSASIFGFGGFRCTEDTKELCNVEQPYVWHGWADAAPAAEQYMCTTQCWWGEAHVDLYKTQEPRSLGGSQALNPRSADSWTSFPKWQVKWALCSFEEFILTQNFNIYSVNDNDCFFFSPRLNNQAVVRGNKIHRTLFEAKKVAGSAAYKQGKTVWNCVVLSVRFVYSVYPVMN